MVSRSLHVSSVSAIVWLFAIIHYIRAYSLNVFNTSPIYVDLYKYVMQEETRKCVVIGKPSVDGLTIEKSKRIRKVAQSEEVSHSQEVNLIHSLLSRTDDQYTKKVTHFLKAKVNGYKQQDLARSLYNESQLISLQEVILKLYRSGLKCCYCSNDVKVMYRTVRDQHQWTLDRIDNSSCHSDANTVIACLECNLKRRLTDKEKFEFTKKLVVKKVNTCYEADAYSSNDVE